MLESLIFRNCAKNLWSFHEDDKPLDVWASDGFANGAVDLLLTCVHVEHD